MRPDGPGQSALLMTEVARLLTARQVPYVVIGAMAGAVHGRVRASLDADALIALPVRDAVALAEALQRAGYVAELRTGDFDDPIPALLQLRDGHGNRVDLLIGLRGMDAQVMDRARIVQFADTNLRVVGREDYVAMKAFAGGPLDLMDAQAVIAAGRGSLDRDLLRRLAAGFGPEAATALEALLASGDAPLP